MRTLLAIVVVVLVLALIGWVSFSNEGSRSSINLETDQIQEDLGDAAEAAGDAAHDVTDSVRD